MTAAAPAYPVDRTSLGVALMIGFCITAPLLDTFGKLAARSLPIAEITAGRYVFQSALLVPLVLLLHLDLRMSGRTLALTFLRAALSIGSTYLFVAAVRVMPLADALAIVFVEPFLLLLVGHFILHEKVGGRRLAAAIVGFIGTMMIVRPSFSVFGTVALLPLGTAVFFAAYILLTRLGSKEMHPLVLQATTALAAVVIAVPTLAIFNGSGIADLDPVMPGLTETLFLLGMGTASAGSHVLLTYALRFASATVLGPLQYLELVSATILGLLVFGDFPDATTWGGIAVIAAAGLYIVHRERVASRAQLPIAFDPPV